MRFTTTTIGADELARRLGLRREHRAGWSTFDEEFSRRMQAAFERGLREGLGQAIVARPSGPDDAIEVEFERINDEEQRALVPKR